MCACACACACVCVCVCVCVRAVCVCAGQVFDVQRKITYRNLAIWYKELRDYRPEIPCLVVANKIDGEALGPLYRHLQSVCVFLFVSLCVWKNMLWHFYVLI